MTDTLFEMPKELSRPLDQDAPVFPVRDPLVLTRGFSRCAHPTRRGR
jgi:hypothetical protein